jgi:hypothetical protein
VPRWQTPRLPWPLGSSCSSSFRVSVPRSIRAKYGAPIWVYCSYSCCAVSIMALCSCSLGSPLAAHAISPLNASVYGGGASHRHSPMCVRNLSTSDALVLEPPYFPLPGGVFESLRMTGSPVTPVLSAVSEALLMSTPLRCAVVRWCSLLAPCWGLLSSAFQPTSAGNGEASYSCCPRMLLAPAVPSWR